MVSYWMGYWVRHRLLPSISLVIVAAIITSALFVFPVIEQKADAYNEQSIYKNSLIDFIAPEPSYEQVFDLPGTEGISKVFPFYYTKEEVKINGKTRTTTVLLSDLFDNINITMYNEKRLIKKSDQEFKNPIYVDWKFCKDTLAKIGDNISFSLNGSKLDFTIQAIYETNSFYDGGAILAKISKEQRNIIAERSKSNGYSAIYISASDYARCKSYLNSEYRPLGRLRDASQFKNSEQYDIHYNAIMSSGYANEITDFRVRNSSLKNIQSTLKVWLGTIMAVVLIFGFNIVMACQGCESGFFTKYCVPKGIEVNSYYKISCIFESILFIVLYAGIILMKIKTSCDYIPKSAIGMIIAVIPIAVCVAEIVSLYTNISKVDAIKTRFKEVREAKEGVE